MIWAAGAARTLESVASIDVRALHHENPVDVDDVHSALVQCLQPIRIDFATDHEASVAYAGDDGVRIVERVFIVRTPCNYGGSRAWWRCPQCERRCTLLYVVSGRLVCRLCGELTYTSSQSTRWIRKLRRAAALKARLGVASDTPWPPRRPPGRHVRTWNRDVERAAAAGRAAMPGVERRRQQLGRRSLELHS